jgi:hypothetical protein
MCCRTAPLFAMLGLFLVGAPFARTGLAADPSVSCNGVCGKVNGVSLTAAPTAKLCEAGTPSTVAGTGPWTWSCIGMKAGTTARCTADPTPRLCANGAATMQCGPAATRAAVWTPAFPPFRTLYYHTAHASFWAQLADDTGPSPTPRELAIASLNQNFGAIKALGFDTVTFSISDSDGWPSGHGGGFSYDPKNPATARQAFAVAQEIALRIADANHLKVTFIITFTPYRFSSDGRPEWAGLADEYDSTSNPRGAYDYIHGLIDPSLYYGIQQTTKLRTIGLADGPTRSFIDDSRIIGWELSGEWNPWVANAETWVGTQQRGFQKYWNFFYNLVHENGARNAFAGTYMIGSPPAVGGTGKQLVSIKTFKQWFAPAFGVIQPDLVGLEFYGGSATANYDLGSVAQDLNKMIDAMENADPGLAGDFSIPANKIYLGEGNENQMGEPGINQYFQDVFQVLTDRGLSGIKFFVSDSLADKSVNGTPTLAVALPVYDIFLTSYDAAGSRKYPPGLPPGISWHLGPKPGGSHADPTTYQSSADLSGSSYGKWTYLQPTQAGVWIRQGIANHAGGRDLRFYAKPNPIPPSGHSTLYWDLSRMPGVRTIAVRIGSASGDLLANDLIASDVRSLAVATPASGSQDFVLVDTTAGGQKVLGSVTVSVK